MEFFRNAYSVRLLGHTGKYLWASEDRKSVAQKKGKDSYGVIWRVEVVPERNTIRLKSVYDQFLHASDYAFLLGATGKKVQQSFASKADSSLEWEPVSAGTYVKLRTNGNKFLRANGGVPPYRNSITHDVPVLASNQNVVLWDVEVVRTKDAPSLPPSRMMSPRVSNASRLNVSPPPNASPPPPLPQPQAESSSDDDDVSVPANIPKHRTRTNPAPRKIEIPPPYSSSPSESASPIASPPRRRRAAPPEQSPPPRRLDSSPSEPVRNVTQRRRGSSRRDTAYDESPPPRRRAADDESPPPRRRAADAAYDESPPPRRRAADAAYDQSPPPRRRAADAAFDHSPPPRRRAADTAYDHSPPPRRRAADAAYDQSPPPRRRAADAALEQSPPPRRRAADTAYDQSPPPPRRTPRDDYDSTAREPRRRRHDDHDSSPEPSPAPRRSPRPVDYEHSESSSRSGREKVKSPDIRRIFYSVAEDDGQVLAHDVGSFGDFMFKGHSLEELTLELQRVTGIHEDIILCMKNPISEKLYKMRLALPPNKAPLSVVIVRSSSQFGRVFSAQTSRQR